MTYHKDLLKPKNRRADRIEAALNIAWFTFWGVLFTYALIAVGAL